MTVAGLILAAGESRRMGRAKALLPFRGQTFVDTLIERFARVCDPVIVVLGHEAERIRAGVQRASQARFAINTAYSLGQLSSMQCGFGQVPPGAGVLFTLVDHPNPAPATLDRLLEPVHAPISIPVFQGRKGHPVYFASEIVTEILALPADSQARVVVRQHARDTRFVEVDDPGILDDVDDAEAYDRLLATSMAAERGK